MGDPDFGELLVRMVVSLAVILGVLAVAYSVLRRRPGLLKFGGGQRAGGQRAGRQRSGRQRGRTPRERSSTARPALRVLGRTGVGRSSTLVAVMFGDEVLLVGASDSETPAVLSRTTLEGWERATEREAAAGDRTVPLPVDPAHRRPAAASRDTGSARPEGRADQQIDHGAGRSVARSGGRDDSSVRSDLSSSIGTADAHQTDATAASLSLIEALRDATARRH